MNDLFSDEKFDKNCSKQDRDSILGSVGVLLILASIILFVLIPAVPKEQAKQSAYQMNATIVYLDKGQDDYIAIIEGQHDGAVERYTVTLSKQEFIEYKEQQPVKVEIRGDHCYIID